MSTTSTNLSLTLAEGSDVVDVDAHIASNFSTLDSKWSSAGNPQAIEVGGSGTPGSSTVVARSDHVHGATTGTPVSIGTTNSAGSNATVSASDHIHKMGDATVPTAAIQDEAVTEAKLDALDSPSNDEVLSYDSGTGRLEWQTVAAITTATPLAAASLAANSVTEAKLDALDTPSDNDVLTYDSGTGRLEWQAASALVDTAIVDGSITRAKLEAVLKPPYGMIQMFGGSSATAPNAAGWLLCNGQSVSRATYSALFAAIGTTYGAGDGSTTFDLPDLRERFPLGVGPSFALGTEGGATTKDLSHTHGVSGNTGGPNNLDGLGNGGGTSTPSTSHGHSVNITTGSGGSATQSILNPYQTVHFFIYAGVAS